MFCEKVATMMASPTVTETYKSFVKAYLESLHDMLDVVTIKFLDGSYTIKKSRLKPFKFLKEVMECDNNDQEPFSIPRTQENFIHLLSFMETETLVGRTDLVRSLRVSSTYHNHSTIIGQSLLEDANYFMIPDRDLAQLDGLIVHENYLVLLERFKVILRRSYPTLEGAVELVSSIIRGPGVDTPRIRIEFEQDEQKKAGELILLHQRLRTQSFSSDDRIDVMHHRLRGTYSVRTIQAYVNTVPPLANR
jgi:hypothetical protein